MSIRIFADQDPGTAIFSVTDGKYLLNSFNGEPIELLRGDLLLVSKHMGKLALKTRHREAFICDSLYLEAKTGRDIFTLRVDSRSTSRQSYSGDLLCLPDLGTMLFINICDIESYVAGVTRSEGGTGKSPEFYKTQTVIVRTYMYRNFYKHISDRYNMCDNTHCQAFHGITTDPVIISSALETSGLVILGPDSTLINSAFHSNCGGETAMSEDVWLTGHSYLKKVQDPYCLTSRNSSWEKSFTTDEWKVYLKKSGYNGNINNLSLLNFSQKTRMKDYRMAEFLIPFRQIRDELKLRSSFFSVYVEGDSVILRGRGYGHGVGLCQEGAMVMASKGIDYHDIIRFYYSGVRISDIKNAKSDKN